MIGLLGNHGAPKDAAASYQEKIDAIFKEQGHLASVLGLDYRQQQSQMAKSVASALVGSHNLLFEAGTVSESLAYPILGLIYAIDFERPFVVSTHTISLQEQIIQKDLELCRQLFKGVPELNAYTGFKSALLLGKATIVVPPGSIQRSKMFARISKANFSYCKKQTLLKLQNGPKIAQTASSKKSIQALPSMFGRPLTPTVQLVPAKLLQRTLFHQRAKKNPIGQLHCHQSQFTIRTY